MHCQHYPLSESFLWTSNVRAFFFFKIYEDIYADHRQWILNINYFNYNEYRQIKRSTKIKTFLRIYEWCMKVNKGEKFWMYQYLSILLSVSFLDKIKWIIIKKSTGWNHSHCVIVWNKMKLFKSGIFYLAVLASEYILIQKSVVLI